jgi:hypothetical protein
MKSSLLWIILVIVIFMVIESHLDAQPGFVDFHIEIYSVYHGGTAYLFLNDNHYPPGHPNYWFRVGDSMPFGQGTTIFEQTIPYATSTEARVVVYHYLRREEQIKPIEPGTNYFFFEFHDMLEDPTPPITP